MQGKLRRPRGRGAAYGDAKSALARERAGGAGGDLHEVYFRMRQSILEGFIQPGEVLNQVHLAERYGVSRTPVREALRLLQAEGLVEAQFQHRMRVTPVTPEEVDAVYAMWITLNALAMSLTIPRLDAAALAGIRTALRAMNARSPLRAGRRADWEPLHRAFHRSLLVHADPAILAAIDTCWSRSERARRTYLRATALDLRHSEREHIELAEAYADRATARAIATSGRHLARVARSVIGNIDPIFKPQAVAQALAMVGATGGKSGSRARRRG